MDYSKVIYEDKNGYTVFSMTEIRCVFTNKRKAIKYYDDVIKCMNRITKELILSIGADLLISDGNVDVAVQVLRNIQLYRTNLQYQPRQFYINIYKVLMHSIDLVEKPSFDLCESINEFYLLTKASVK